MPLLWNGFGDRGELRFSDYRTIPKRNAQGMVLVTTQKTGQMPGYSQVKRLIESFEPIKVCGVVRVG